MSVVIEAGGFRWHINAEGTHATVLVTREQVEALETLMQRVGSTLPSARPERVGTAFRVSIEDVNKIRALDGCTHQQTEAPSTARRTNRLEEERLGAEATEEILSTALLTYAVQSGIASDQTDEGTLGGTIARMIATSVASYVAPAELTRNHLTGAARIVAQVELALVVLDPSTVRLTRKDLIRKEGSR